MSERPTGFGFGAALLQSAPFFQAALRSHRGEPVAEREVWFGLFFMFAEPPVVCSAAELVAQGREADPRARAEVVARYLEKGWKGDEATLQRTLEARAAVLANAQRERPAAWEALQALCAESGTKRWGDAPVPTMRLRVAPDGAGALRVNPRLVASPPPEVIGAFYPDRARREEVEGTTTARCRVSTEGLMKDCVLTAEQPAGFDFGSTLLRLAGSFRYAPALEDGLPVEEDVVLPMRFRLPD